MQNRIAWEQKGLWQLLARAIAGEREAYDRFFDASCDEIYRLSHGALRDCEAAEWVTEAVLTRVVALCASQSRSAPSDRWVERLLWSGISRRRREAGMRVRHQSPRLLARSRPEPAPAPAPGSGTLGPIGRITRGR